MKNIIWKRPDGVIAETVLAPWNEQSSQEHADELLRNGTIPGDWECLGYDMPAPLQG